MRSILLAGAAAAMFWTTTTTIVTPAHATVRVSIDLSHQRMHVEGRSGAYDWPISSARSGFSTPGGSYAPTHLERMHYSKKYHMSPMPHAIFFRGGYAIHGTYAVGQLGRPASHGCVRLSPSNAAELYDMVKQEGARISISGTPPASRAFAEHRSRHRPTRYATRTYEGADSDVNARSSRRAARGGRIVGYVYPAPSGGIFDGGLLPQTGPIYALPPN